MASAKREEIGDVQAAADHVVGKDNNPWPYFILRSADVENRLTSVLQEFPEERDYVRNCGFDIFLHKVDDETVLFFSYGHFRAAVSLDITTDAMEESAP